jgi:hypothetical protein
MVAAVRVGVSVGASSEASCRRAARAQASDHQLVVQSIKEDCVEIRSGSRSPTIGPRARARATLLQRRGAFRRPRARLERLAEGEEPLPLLVAGRPAKSSGTRAGDRFSAPSPPSTCTGSRSTLPSRASRQELLEAAGADRRRGSQARLRRDLLARPVRADAPSTSAAATIVAGSRTSTRRATAR